MAQTIMTQLDYLRSRSAVDCDTLDVTVPAALGPFVDCTSNQAIAHGELLKPLNAPLLSTAASHAKQLKSTTYTSPSDPSLPALTVEIAMAMLSLQIAPHLTGYIHIQTNPLSSFDKDATILNARRIHAHIAFLEPTFPKERICIKIPSTWEGLQACRTLEKEGIATLATTLFNVTQAAVAADVGCKYVAPYVNRLGVHFIPGLVDMKKGFEVCAQVQRYFELFGDGRIECLPASLISTTEVLMLAGAKHITVAPMLLEALAKTPYEAASTVASVFDAPAVEMVQISLADDEAGFRLAMNRSQDGGDAERLVEAINIFCKQQEQLEVLATAALAALG